MPLFASWTVTAPSGGQARGDARRALLDRLIEIERQLTRAARVDLDPALADTLRREAVEEIAPFAGRMTTAARDAAIDAAFERRLRDAIGLPIIRFED